MSDLRNIFSKAWFAKFMFHQQQYTLQQIMKQAVTQAKILVVCVGYSENKIQLEFPILRSMIYLQEQLRRRL
jgi:hypothetical protein